MLGRGSRGRCLGCTPELGKTRELCERTPSCSRLGLHHIATVAEPDSDRRDRIVPEATFERCEQRGEVEIVLGNHYYPSFGILL